MFTHEVLSTLNELEISIYNHIVKNQDKIATMKIRELAEEEIGRASCRERV